MPNLREEGLSKVGFRMELNVSQLLMDPSGSSRGYELDDAIDLVENFGNVGIRGSVNLLRTNKSIWVSAALDSTIDSECGRCLAYYPHPIHIEVQEEYLPVLNPMTGERLAPPPENSDICMIDDNHILDLTAVVREYATMAAPMKPLCDQDCLGLCAHCGSDLNRTDCDCDLPIDPRWSPLLRLTGLDLEPSASRS